jgi:S-adenosylmethionine:tRNA-ribosyltransferase-isomerase (queuine synthetase)
MKLKDLDFEFPEELIANEPQRPSRVMYVNSSGSPEEISISRLKEKFRSGDVLIIN